MIREKVLKDLGLDELRGTEFYDNLNHISTPDIGVLK